jgi:hypothetical protein
LRLFSAAQRRGEVEKSRNASLPVRPGGGEERRRRREIGGKGERRKGKMKIPKTNPNARAKSKLVKVVNVVRIKK